MRRFTYFIPGAHGISERQLADMQLLDRLVPSWSQGEGGAGPVAGGGLFIVCGEWDNKWKYSDDPEKQIWLKAGAYWVGMETALPPGPEDLVRGDEFENEYYVPLSDGNKWTVPTVDGLPRYLGLDDSGEYVHKVKPRYRPMLAKAEKILAWYQSQRGYTDQTHELLETEAREICADVLGLKYRIGPFEMDLLGLPTTADRQAILQYFINTPLIDAMHEKPEQAAKTA